jgi:hypothetical protein
MFPQLVDTDVPDCMQSRHIPEVTAVRTSNHNVVILISGVSDRLRSWKTWVSPSF